MVNFIIPFSRLKPESKYFLTFSKDAQEISHPNSKTYIKDVPLAHTSLPLAYCTIVIAKRQKIGTYNVTNFNMELVPKGYAFIKLLDAPNSQEMRGKVKWNFDQ